MSMFHRSQRKNLNRHGRSTLSGSCTLEQLECRRLLAAVSWTGSAGDNQWTSPGNWSSGQIPSATDDVTIHVPGTPTIEYGFITRTIKSLDSTVPLRFVSGFLTIQTTARNTAATTLDGGHLLGGEWDATAEGITFASGGGSLENVHVQGDIHVDSSGSAAIMIGTTRWSVMHVTASGSSVAMISGFVLRDPIICERGGVEERSILCGTISIAPTASIRVANDCQGNVVFRPFNVAIPQVLTNDGLLSCDSPRSTIFMEMPFINRSTVDIHGGGLRIRFDGEWSNSGTITSDPGSTLFLAASWVNTGTIAVTDSTVTLAGTVTTTGLGLAGFHRYGGTVTLGAALDNAGSILELNNSTGDWTMSGLAEIKGGTVQFRDGATLKIAGGVFNDVLYEDSIRLGIENTTVYIRGNTRFQSLRLAAGGTHVMLESNLLDSIVAEGAGTLTRVIDFAEGIVLAPSAIVRLAADCQSGLSLQGVSVTNNGTILSESASQELNIFGAQFVNNTALGGASGKLNIGSTTWINNGSISVIPGAAVAFYGKWTNAGVITVTGGSLNLGGSFSTPAIGILNRSSGSAGVITLSGALDNASHSLNFNELTGSWELSAGTITGGSVLTADGQGLIPSSNDGTLRNVTYAGDLLLNKSQAILTVGGTTRFGSAQLGGIAATLYFEPGYTLFDAVTSNSVNTLAHTVGIRGSGSITIAPSGSIVQLSTSKAGLVIWADNATSTLINNGRIESRSPAGPLQLSNFKTITNNALLTADSSTIQFTTTGSWTLSNPGTIQITNGTLILLGNWSNTGVIQAANSTVNLGGNFSSVAVTPAHFARTDGVVSLTGRMSNSGRTFTMNAATGSWLLAGGRIDGGSITFADSASLVITITEGRLADVIVNGQLRLNTTGAKLALSGNTRFSSIALSAGDVVLHFVPGYVLRDSVASEGAAIGTRTISSSASNGVFTIDITGSIRLSPESGGDLVVAGGVITNAGLISAESGLASLILSPNTFTNSGILRVSAGRIAVDKALTNVTNYSASAHLLAGGEWAVEQDGALNWLGVDILTIGAGTTVRLGGAGSAFHALDNCAQNAGQLTVAFGHTLVVQPVSGTFLNTGTLRVDPAGIFSVVGSFVQSPGGSIISAVAADSTFGRIEASGTATVDGTLNIAVAQGALVRGSSFEILRATSLNGNFAKAQIVGINDFERAVLAYSPTDVRVNVTALCDWNRDGFVTGDDYDAFVDRFIAGESDADINGDGFVTGDDLDAFLFSFLHG